MGQRIYPPDGGWYIPEQCQWWDGDDGRLGRTPGNRWIIEDSSGAHWITEEQVPTWMSAHGHTTEQIAEALGIRLQDSGMRPFAITDARTVTFRWPETLIGDVDAAARTAGVSRAVWVRWACEQQLGTRKGPPEHPNGHPGGD